MKQKYILLINNYIEKLAIKGRDLFYIYTLLKTSTLFKHYATEPCIKRWLKSYSVFETDFKSFYDRTYIAND